MENHHAIKFGKPSISMGQLYHGELLVITSCCHGPKPWDSPTTSAGRRLNMGLQSLGSSRSLAEFLNFHSEKHWDQFTWFVFSTRMCFLNQLHGGTCGIKRRLPMCICAPYVHLCSMILCTCSNNISAFHVETVFLPSWLNTKNVPIIQTYTNHLITPKQIISNVVVATPSPTCHAPLVKFKRSVAEIVWKCPAERKPNVTQWIHVRVSAHGGGSSSSPSPSPSPSSSTSLLPCHDHAVLALSVSAWMIIGITVMPVIAGDAFHQFQQQYPEDTSYPLVADDQSLFTFTLSSFSPSSSPAPTPA